MAAVSLFSVYGSALEKCQFRPSAHFQLNCWFGVSFLCILEINPLSDALLASISRLTERNIL